MHRPKKEPGPLERDGKEQGAPWGSTQEGQRQEEAMEMASSHTRCLGVTQKF